MCIRHLGFITGVNQQPLKMQGRFEDGKKKSGKHLSNCTWFFPLLIKFQLVKATGLPQCFIKGDCTTHRASGGEQRVGHRGFQGFITNRPSMAQQLSVLVRKVRLKLLWSHSSDWVFQTSFMIAQMYWENFLQESVSNAPWMNLVFHVVTYNIFCSESSVFHHENLLPNSESLRG